MIFIFRISLPILTFSSSHHCQWLLIHLASYYITHLKLLLDFYLAKPFACLQNLSFQRVVSFPQPHVTPSHIMFLYAPLAITALHLHTCPPVLTVAIEACKDYCFIMRSLADVSCITSAYYNQGRHYESASWFTLKVSLKHTFDILSFLCQFI